MKSFNRQNPLIIVLAIVGVCAMAFGLWSLYQRQTASEEAHKFFSGPTSSGIPDILHKNNAPPPPQP